MEDSKTQLSQFPFQLRTLKQEIWKRFEKKIRKKKLIKMVADKKLRSSDKEEELLLQDFSRRVSAKSSALFYGNAFIVSGMANIVCKKVVFVQSQTQFLGKQNCSKLLFFSWLEQVVEICLQFCDFFFLLLISGSEPRRLAAPRAAVFYCICGAHKFVMGAELSPATENIMCVYFLFFTHFFRAISSYFYLQLI